MVSTDSWMYMTKLRLRWGIPVLVAVGAHVVSATTITVNTAADNLMSADGSCTLREAITNVNAAADTSGADCSAGTGAGDSITFNLRLPAKIKLVLGELAIEDDVDIIGPASALLGVSGTRS